MQKKSFTLVELMIVIAILAILSAIVIFALNPARLFDNVRDTSRVTDITAINKAIVFMESWSQSGINYGTTTNVYISLPDSNSNCSGYTLPTLPAGYSYYCSSPANYKKTDSTGWIPINFNVGTNSYLTTLPVDPVNNSTYFYTYYTGGSYEVTALLANPNKNSINDEGSLTSTFEIGSPNRSFNTPLQRDKGLVGYWDFNETSGIIAYDKSGYGNNGTLTNGPVSTTTAYGERNLYFDGANDKIIITSNPIFDLGGAGTFLFWHKIDTWPNNYNSLIRRGGGGWCSNDYRPFTLFNHYTSDYITVSICGLNTTTQATYVSPRPTAGSWYFYSYTYDQSFIKAYLNAVQSYSGNNNVVMKSDVYDVTMGESGGWMDSISLYNRALSQEEISKIYNQTKSHYGL